MLSDTKIKRAKLIKPNEFNEKFIRDFSTEWNIVRKLANMGLKRYEELYRDNKEFREYVERYMRNKNVKLKEVLKLKQIQLVADEYERENNESKESKCM